MFLFSRSRKTRALTRVEREILLTTSGTMLPPQHCCMHVGSTAFGFWLCKIRKLSPFSMFILKFHNSSRWRVIKRVSPFHASHKMRVFRERENKNMKILQVSRLYGMQRTQRSILKTKIQPMAIAYPCFIEVRL